MKNIVFTVETDRNNVAINIIDTVWDKLLQF